MRIGIDVDDTVCETWKYLKPYFKKSFKTDRKRLRYNRYHKALNCTLEEYYDFCRNNISSLMLNVPIKRDAKKYINKLKDDGHEIIFITARSDKDLINPYEVTKKYLEKNKIKYDELFTGCLEKDTAARHNNIDVFIDDSVKHCTSVYNIGIPVLLMKTSYNRNCHKFRHVYNWKEVYNIISKMR